MFGSRIISEFYFWTFEHLRKSEEGDFEGILHDFFILAQRMVSYTAVNLAS